MDQPLNIQPTTEYNNKSKNEMTPTENKYHWNIATCNIRGLSEFTKRELWFQYGKEQNWNIIITTEMDGSHHHSKYWKSKFYKSWWSHGTKNLGQGIGISLENNLATRTFKIQEWEGRIIAIDLAFPLKKYIRIIGVYYPTGNNPLKQTVNGKINNLITEAQAQNWHIIVAGDFNGTPNPVLDKHSPNHQWQKSTPSNKVIQCLIDHSLIDSYREINPQSKEYTWHNTSGSSSRIDQIWISPSNIWNIQDAYIDSSTCPLIKSDHRPTICKLETWQLELTNHNNLHTPNRRLNWNEASPEQWNDFSTFIESHLTTGKNLGSSTDQQWNKLRNIMLHSAKKYIPKCKNHRKNRHHENTPLTSARIVTLQRLAQKINQYLKAQNDTQTRWDEIVQIYNKAQVAYNNIPSIITDPTAHSVMHIQKWHQKIKDFLLQHHTAF